MNWLVLNCWFWRELYPWFWLGIISLVTLNGYYDFVNESAFTRFISAGLGCAKVEVNDFNIPGSGLPSENDDDTVFAYQIGADVAYAVSEKVSLDVKYRYFATSDPDFDGTEVEYSSHNIYAGIRVNF